MHSKIKVCKWSYCSWNSFGFLDSWMNCNWPLFRCINYILWCVCHNFVFSKNVASSGWGKNQCSLLICATTEVTEILQVCQSDKCYLSLSSSNIAGLVCHLQKQINKITIFFKDMMYVTASEKLYLHLQIRLLVSISQSIFNSVHDTCFLLL